MVRERRRKGERLRGIVRKMRINERREQKNQIKGGRKKDGKMEGNSMRKKKDGGGIERRGKVY